MRAGPLRERITIQVKSVTRDDYGGEVETWATFATVWASVSPLIGREYMAARQTQAETTHKIRLRYLSGLLPTHRISWAGRIFEIESILDVDERHREMVVMATEAL